MIATGDGNNVVIGGLGADSITTGSGGDVILGDSGYAQFDSAGNLSVIYTTSPDAVIGGTKDTGTSSNDIINAGNGDNVVFGGVGADQITTGAGADFILGDDGYGTFTYAGGARAPNRVLSIDPTFGGNDTIHSGSGNDLIFGETGNDLIYGEGGNDIIFGDFASYDASRVANARALSIFTGVADGGGNDEIHGGNGNSYMVGGQGDDLIYAGIGDNDIIGDNNTPGGTVGNDTIYGGPGNDVILGDNGQIYRQVVVDDWKNMTWARNPAPFSDLIRQVTTYDELVGGNDTISGGGGLDRLFGQAGNDTITAGSGSAEIIGGLGSNNINGGSGNDIIVGGEGKIARALNPDGTPLLNSDGTWHRDVVLEEVGSITGAVAIDSAGHALQSSLAASLLNADMVLLAGAYDSTGAKLVNSDDHAWQTEALLVSLTPVTGSTIVGGSGNDFIFGTLGNDTITGGSGNDVIFGDRASNTLSSATDIPHIVNGVLITGAASATSLALPFNGQLVTPAVNLLPSALTAGMPQVELGPATDAGSLRAMAQSGDLARSDGTTLKVLASVIPDLIHNQNALPGSDVINTGSGNDVVFGDYGLIGALPTTGVAAIDLQLQGLSVSMQGLINGFSVLSTAQDALEHALGTSTRPFSISAGNNTITGSGTETIFGAGGEYLVPGVSFPMDAASASGNPLAFDGYLLDLQEVVGDMSFVTHEAGEQVIHAFATATGFSGSYDPTATALRPATHLLNIENNTIDLSASSGNNVVVGGTGFVIMPGVATPATGGASVDAGALQQLESSRKAALAAHFASDHPFTADNGAAAQWLFNQTIGFQINIGNDHIVGGAGDDILVGDNALILQPVSGTASLAGSAASLQATMVATVDRLFLGSYSAQTSTAAAFGAQATLAHTGAADWSLAGGYIFQSGNTIVLDSDTIDGGPGNDHVYGDMAVILPQLGSAGVGTVGAFGAFPSSELGGTAEADYNYVYGFGPFGSLHPSSDPHQLSAFTIDADTIHGSAGNDVLFGELGNDNIDGGAGDDQISGGFGLNTLSGGTGTNQLAFDRSRDTHVDGGGDDIARSSLDDSAGSPILSINWQSAVGSTIGNGMLNPIKGPLSWTGNATAPAVYQPVVTGVTVTPIGSGLPLTFHQSLAASSLFTVSDPLGYPITQYALWDTGSGGAHFVVNGVVQPAQQTFIVSAAQLAQTIYVVGLGTDVLRVQGSDGIQFGPWQSITMVGPVDTGPFIRSSNLAFTPGKVIAASSLFTAGDLFGHPITEYQFWDSTRDPASGHFYINGVQQAAGTVIDVPASQIGSVTFITGTVSNALQVRVSDGVMWSAADTAAWAPFSVNVVAAVPPVVTTSNIGAAPGQTLAASSLFTVSDPNGYAITEYQFWDSTRDAASGHFYINGVQQAPGTVIDVTAAQVQQGLLTFVTGTVSNSLQVRAFDGTSWSASDTAAWSPFTVNINASANTPPVVQTSNITKAPNQTLLPSDLWQASDSDGDAITAYQLWDSTRDPASGHFFLGGVQQAPGTVINVTAAQVQQGLLTFVTGTVSSALQVRAFDGVSWSAGDTAAWSPFNVNVAASPPPVVITSNISTVPNQTFAASRLLSVSDPNGYAITEYQFWDSTRDAASGHFYINGVQQAPGTVIDVPASQIGAVTFVTGTVSNALQARAFDGVSWSAGDTAAWSPFNVTAVALPATIAAGGTLELASLFSGTLSFAAGTGTLKIDNSSSFNGSIGGQLAIGDVIDLADITAGANASIGYSGNNSPGTLTVSDGTHTARIVLSGNYALANFTASSDGHGGTSIVDPPVMGQVSVPRAPIASVGDAQAATATAGPPAGSASFASVNAASIGALSESAVSAPVASPSLPVSLENGSAVGLLGGGSPLIFVQSPAGSGTSVREAPEGSVLPGTELPQSAIAREIVSPDDVILAIREGDITFKIDTFADANSERSPWLFDGDRGTFEAPLPEPLTIVIDGDEGDRLAQTGAPVQALTGEVVPDESWFGAFRKLWMQPARSLWWR